MEKFLVMPVKLNDVYEMRIDNLSDSQGIGSIDGFKVFVDGLLPGEIARVMVTQLKKNYAVGKALDLLKRSKDRIEPQCPIYNECGGCQLQHLSYSAQLNWKRQQVIDALKRIGKLNLKNILIKDTIGMNEPWNYRNKMQFPVSKANSDVKIGCYAKGTHDVIDVNNCLIQRELNNEILQAARKVIAKFKIPIYDEDKHRGILRHVMGRVGANGEIMLVLVTAVENLPNAKSIVRALRNELPQITSIQQNIQPQHNNVILGRKTNILYGKRTIVDKIGDFKFNISARSFFQVNTSQAEKLYKTALDFADLHGNEIVVDVYCGTGTITLFLAKRAKFAYGIEIVSSAIADAKVNARVNNIRNVEFVVGDATVMLPRLGVKPDVIVIDPPRAGCDEAVLKSIVKMTPSRVVYVSCNPSTLARDLAILEMNGFKVEKVQPVDMFPQTSHIESVTLLRHM